METVCRTNRKVRKKEQVQLYAYLANEHKEAEKRLQLSAYLARRSETAIVHDDFCGGFDAGEEYGHMLGYREAIHDVQAILQERHAAVPSIQLV